MVLQASAVEAWTGAADFDNSLMQGGTVETDYDVICRCPEGVTKIRRYDRDMLVLCDSEWRSRFVPGSLGEVCVLQYFGVGEGPEDLVTRLRARTPDLVVPFELRDRELRLMVGADSGRDSIYESSAATAQPGPKVCLVYLDEGGQLVVIQDAPR